MKKGTSRLPLTIEHLDIWGYLWAFKGHKESQTERYFIENLKTIAVPLSITLGMFLS
jgi:hypothetical protein